MATAGTTAASDAQRVDDYLDDQIADVRDLSRIDVLIARVVEQQSVLQSQVRTVIVHPTFSDPCADRKCSERTYSDTKAS